MRTAASLHDIGKFKIPKIILNKPGSLTNDEFEIVKTHTVLGAEMLKSIQGKIGDMARAVCLYHHEWFDGSKSYWGIRASDLPIYIPIISMCDVFTALIAKRSYKKPWSLHEALAYIRSHSGTQFSPELVNKFILLIQRNDHISVNSDKTTIFKQELNYEQQYHI